MKMSRKAFCALLVVALAVPAVAGAPKKDVAAQAKAAVNAAAKAIAGETEAPKKQKRKKRKKKATAAKPATGKGPAAAAADADVEDAPPPSGKATIPVPKDPQDFASFWTSFQTVIAAEDKDALVGLIEFPFTTRGPMDTDPVEKHNATWVKGHLDEILEGTASDDSMDGIVEDTTPAAAAKEVKGSEASIGSFSFKKTAKGWHLVHAYVGPCVGSDDAEASVPAAPAASAPSSTALAFPLSGHTVKMGGTEADVRAAFGTLNAEEASDGFTKILSTSLADRQTAYFKFKGDRLVGVDLYSEELEGMSGAPMTNFNTWAQGLGKGAEKKDDTDTEMTWKKDGSTINATYHFSPESGDSQTSFAVTLDAGR